MPVTGALVVGVASVAGSAVSSTINGLFQAGKIKSEKEAIQMQTKLSVLSNQQQNILNQQLLKAQTDTDRMKILTDAVAGIKQSQNSDVSKAGNYTMIMALAGGFALLLTVVIYKKFGSSNN